MIIIDSMWRISLKEKKEKLDTASDFVWMIQSTFTICIEEKALVMFRFIQYFREQFITYTALFTAVIIRRLSCFFFAYQLFFQWSILNRPDYIWIVCTIRVSRFHSYLRELSITYSNWSWMTESLMNFRPIRCIIHQSGSRLSNHCSEFSDSW